MITLNDLQEAIAECQGKRNPDASTCIKLAAFLTIKEHLYPEPEPEAERPTFPSYSYASDPDTITWDGESDFSRAINGKEQAEVWPIIDELMSTLQMLNKSLYNGVMRRLEQ